MAEAETGELDPLKERLRKRTRAQRIPAHGPKLQYKPRDLHFALLQLRPKLRRILMYKVDFFSRITNFSLSAAGLLALSAARHATDPPIHHGASVGPGRAPWRVLWAFAKSGNHGIAFRPAT